MKILIIEDEKKIAELIQNRLKQENYTIDLSFDGEDGFYKAMSKIYDLIILDVMLPYKDGFTILNELRENNVDSQILMLTARSELEDKLKAFDKGCNDYLTKPFHLEELVARVNSKLKIKNYNNELKFGDVKLDLKTKKIININTNEDIEVLCKEFLILECLMKNKNQIISKEFIYDYVWGMDNESISNNLEAYMSFIRKKLKLIESNVNIKSVRGLGYKLEVQND